MFICADRVTYVSDGDEHNGAPSLAFTVYVRALRGITISNSRARRRRQQTMKHYTFACNSSNVNRTNWFSSIRRRTHFTCHCSVNFTLGDYRIGFSSLFSFSSASASFVVVDRRGRRAYILCFGPSKNNNKIIATECRQQQPRNSAINGYIITSIELLAFTVRSPTSSVTYMRCLLCNDADDDISIQRIRWIFRVFRICASAFPSRSSNEIHRPKKESKEDEEAERGKNLAERNEAKKYSAFGSRCGFYGRNMWSSTFACRCRCETAEHIERKAKTERKTQFIFRQWFSVNKHNIYSPSDDMNWKNHLSNDEMCVHWLCARHGPPIFHPFVGIGAERFTWNALTASFPLCLEMIMMRFVFIARGGWQVD